MLFSINCLSRLPHGEMCRERIVAHNRSLEVIKCRAEKVITLSVCARKSRSVPSINGGRLQIAAGGSKRGASSRPLCHSCGAAAMASHATTKCVWPTLIHFGHRCVRGACSERSSAHVCWWCASGDVCGPIRPSALAHTNICKHIITHNTQTCCAMID